MARPIRHRSDTRSRRRGRLGWRRLPIALGVLLCAAAALADASERPGTIRLPADSGVTTAPSSGAGRLWHTHGLQGLYPPAGPRDGAPAAPAMQRDAAARARAWVDRRADRLGFTGSALRPVDTRRAGRLRHEFYARTHEGLPVIGAAVRFTYDDAGALIQAAARAAGLLAPPGRDPSVTLAEAHGAALWGLQPAGAWRWRSGELAVLPRQVSGLASDRLVWRLVGVDEGERLSWRMLIDAHSGQVLERRPNVVGVAGYHGDAQAWITTPTPWGERSLVGLPHLETALYDGATLVEQTFTDDAGGFTFGTAPQPGWRLATRLAGRYAVIHPHTLGDPVPELRVGVPPEGTAVIWDSLTTLPAALEAYVHLQTARDWLARVDPSFTWLDRPVPVVVEDPTDVCNALAYIDPEDPWLRFLIGTDLCTSSARLADVVYHEYGHLITMYAYHPDYPTDAMHEAFSDYFAATLSDTSAMGLHFFGPDEPPVRDLDHDFAWPVPAGCVERPHCYGLLLGGALWHMRAGLIEALGNRDRGVALADSLFVLMRAAKPMSFDECLVQLLVQDDDDHDLGNGTPHLEPIAAAFERHNIGDFTVYLVHEPPPDTEEPLAQIPVDVAVRSIYPLTEGGVRIHYDLGDGERTAEMEPIAGADRRFRFELPPVGAGTTVRYHFTAVDASGREGRTPAGAPAERFAIHVGVDETAPTLAHEQPGPLTTDREGLWLTARADDNTGRVASVTARGEVHGPSGARTVSGELTLKDPAADPPVYQGFLLTGPLAEGDTLRYHLEARDGSAASNAARAPAEGAIALQARPGRTWDLEDGAEELQPGGDWELGAPVEGPPPQSSGSRVAATGLGGRYANGLRSVLTLPPIDMGPWKAAYLEFWSWYRAEQDWDGGWLEASVDGGQSWVSIHPSDGYTGSIPIRGDDSHDGGFSRPAFTGASMGWKRVIVPLDAYLGGPLMVRFVFDADEIYNDLGWYIDDLKICASQAIVPPVDLTATEGDDRRVGLSWHAPRGIDTSAPSFLGYNVYRGEAPGPLATVALNPAPHASPWWYDSQVENGRRYVYAVTSVFASGESGPSALAEGYPYQPALGGDALAGERRIVLEGASAGADTLRIENAGTGPLRVDLYHADAQQTWAQTLPTFTLQSRPEFETVAVDPPADAPAPDLLRLDCRLTGEHLQMRIKLAEPMGDPTEAFTMALFLDTDRSRSTGLPGPNTGAEYLIVMGREVFQKLAQKAVVVSAEGTLVGPPGHLILQEGLDSIEVAVTRTSIGHPAKVGLAVAVGAEGLLPDPQYLRASAGRGARWAESVRRWLQDIASDRLPDEPRSDWLLLDETFADISPGEPWPMTLRVDLSGRIEDEYAAQLFLGTNDPQRRVAGVPILVELLDLPAEGLASWTARSEPSGLRLSWLPEQENLFSGFLLDRWQGSLEDEPGAVRLGTGPITTFQDGVYTYLDRSAAPGGRYFYRLRGIDAGGDTLLFAPPAHPRYDPPVASRLVLETARPNPFRSATQIRVRVPAGRAWELAVYDVGGRLVRRLVERGALAAGTHLVAWDGRTDRGGPASQGVYFAVARDGRDQATGRLLLLR